MAKPTIADLLDQALDGGVSLKLDKYLDKLPPDIRDRVLFHLHERKPDGTWAMPSRRIATTISDDPSTSFTISASAIDTWRTRHVTGES